MELGIDALSNITTPTGLKVAFIILGAIIANAIGARIIDKVADSAFRLRHDSMSAGEKRRRDTIMRIGKSLLTVVIVVITILTILSTAGINIAPVLASAGVAGVAISLGGQYFIRDIIGGLFVITESQYRVGDVVSLDGVSGTVEDISLRSTTLRSLNGNVHHIPNGSHKVVTNLSKGHSGIEINLTVEYDTDVTELRNLIDTIGNTMADEPAWKKQIVAAPQFLRIDELGTDGIVAKITGKTAPLKQWEVAGEFRTRLLIQLRQHGIKVAQPQEITVALPTPTSARKK